MKKKLILIFSWICFVQMGIAQTNTFPNQSLSAAITADAFTGLEISYNNRFELFSKESIVKFNLNLPLLLNIQQKSVHALGVDISVENLTISKEKFMLLSEIGIDALYHHQVLGNFYPVSLHFRVTPSFKIKNGYIGFLFGFQQTVTSYIHFSNYVKQRFTEIYDISGNEINVNPQNGFYNFTGQQYEIGIAGRVGVFKKDFIYYETGYRDYLSAYTNAVNAMMFGQIPFFIKLRYDFAIK